MHQAKAASKNSDQVNLGCKRKDADCSYLIKIQDRSRQGCKLLMCGQEFLPGQHMGSLIHL